MPKTEAEPSGIRSLLDLITEQLRTSPSGLYALQPPELSEDIHLVAVTRERLTAASHALALTGSTQIKSSHSAAELAQRRHEAEIAIIRVSRALESFEKRVGNKFPRHFRDTCWRVDPSGIVPPNSIYQLLISYPEAFHRPACLAVAEYVLRSDSPRPSQFIQSLRFLFAEVEAMRDEPVRRNHILLSLIKRAETNHFPYWTEQSASRSRTIIEWQIYPEFLMAVIELFFRDILPQDFTRHIHGGARNRFRFAQLAEWFGTPQLDLEMPSLSAESHPAAGFAELLAKQMEPLPKQVLDAYQTRLANLTGQFAAILKDPDCPASIVSWLSACRHISYMTKTGDGIWHRAVSVLEQWFIASESDSRNLRRLFEILPERSFALLSRNWVENCGPHFPGLARLGKATKEEALHIVDFELVADSNRLLRNRNERLVALASVIKENKEAWDRMARQPRQQLTNLFAEIEYLPLLPQLIRWIERLRVERSIDFYDITSSLWSIDCFAKAEKSAESRTRREQFLSSHLWILDKVEDEIAFCLQRLPEDQFEEWHDRDYIWGPRFGIVEILYQWTVAGFSGVNTLTNLLFAWCRKNDDWAIARKFDYPPVHFDRISKNERLVVELSQGCPRHFTALVDWGTSNWQARENPLMGWHFLVNYPSVRESLGQLCRDPRRLRWAIQILGRLALALRLQRHEYLHTRFQEWNAATTLTEPISILDTLGKLAGFDEPFPPVAERAIERESALRQERDTLSEMQAKGRLSASAAIRLAKLSRLLETPSEITKWVENDARRELAKILPKAKISALDVITREAIRSHWRQMFRVQPEKESRDWDNALRFYYTADKNKGLLRRLLEHTAKGGPEWNRQYPPNAKFLADLESQGLQADRWLEPFQKTAEVHGETWTLHREQNPLRILQMGNLFGTCLSVDDFNAFAAIANAAEVNKQVLYLRDSRWATVGRKLVGLDAHGRLFGFRSYGATCLRNLGKSEKPHVWIKILFDLACLELAHRIGGRLEHAPDPKNAADQLQLTAEWYNDGPEPFDWWVGHPDLTDSILLSDKQAVALAVLAYISKHNIDFHQTHSETMATLRALLWLGDEALIVIDSLGLDAFDPAGIRFLRSQSASLKLKASLESSRSIPAKIPS